MKFYASHLCTAYHWTSAQPETEKQLNIYTLCFLPVQHTLHTGFSQTTLYRTAPSPALPEEDFLHVFTDFHINTNTHDILSSPKNWRQKVSLTSVSNTASQRYQGMFSCSVKTLLCHLQQCSSRNTTAKVPEKKERFMNQGNRLIYLNYELL